MAFVFSERSKKRLSGIHPDLQAVMALALERTPIDFTVLEGLRTLERQKQLVAKGASKTMNSRHLTGHAVDIAPLDDAGDVSWSWPLYHQLSPVVKQAAKDLGVDIEWGGDWRTFKDGPHWQLSWNTYAADDMKPRASLNGSKVVASPPEPDDEFVFAPKPIEVPSIALPPPAQSHVVPIPPEVHDLIEESSGEGSITRVLMRVQELMGLLGISIPTVLAALDDLDPIVAAAIVGVSGALFYFAWRTHTSRDRKAEKALKAKYKIEGVQ